MVYWLLRHHPLVLSNIPTQQCLLFQYQLGVSVVQWCGVCSCDLSAKSTASLGTRDRALPKPR